MTIEKLERAIRKIVEQGDDEEDEFECLLPPVRSKPADPPPGPVAHVIPPFSENPQRRSGLPLIAVLGAGIVVVALPTLLAWSTLHRDPASRAVLPSPADSMSVVSTTPVPISPTGIQDSSTRARIEIEWKAGSTARCRDGWFSHSHHRSGTCSGHHGVAVWRYPATDPIWQ